MRGYRRLEPWSLRRAADEQPQAGDEGGSDEQGSPSAEKQGKGLRRGADQSDDVTEGTSGGEDVD